MKYLFLAVFLASCPAFAQTATYQWTDPISKSTTTLSMPSTWQFSVITSDGIVSMAPGGAALHTSAGSWTWGSAATTRPGEYSVDFNGVPVGIGSSMEVNHGGQIYVDTLHGGWFLWNGTGFAGSAAP